MLLLFLLLFTIDSINKKFFRNKCNNNIMTTVWSPSSEPSYKLPDNFLPILDSPTIIEGFNFQLGEEFSLKDNENCLLCRKSKRFVVCCKSEYHLRVNMYNKAG